jgi:hypothetical protein
LVHHPHAGCFVAGTLDATRILLIPVVHDHHYDGVSLWGEAHADFSSTASYMAATATKALRVMSDVLKPPDEFLSAHHVIFVLSDPFFYLSSDEYHSSRQYLGGDGEVFIDKFSDSESSALMAAGVGAASWVDVANQAEIAARSLPSTVAIALARENAFCSVSWPWAVTGQWTQIQTLCRQLGVAQLFAETHAFLKQHGWHVDFAYKARNPDYAWFHRDANILEYMPPDGANCVSVRLLFHRISTQSGLTFLLSSEDNVADRLNNRFFQVRYKSDLKPFLSQIGGSSAGN